MTRLRLCAAIPLALALTMTGCSTTVAMEAAAEANDPSCADVMVRLPDRIAGEDRRWTDAQSTASWGDPSSVLLTCGVPVVGASELPCQSAGGVDWIIDDSDAPRYRFTSFGRSPAIEVYLDYEIVSSRDVLDAIGAKADEVLPVTGAACTDLAAP
ncbi:DUF3515 family protein [Microbacterium sp.]|uniref:DUF3515 family protein n=1 Tax=Microbacterium sp. TaxID=51671 RepID=UPI003A871CA7